MPLLQYLILCDDKSLCIVRRTSINDSEHTKLTEGQRVSFLWPEDPDPDGSPRKEYNGVIVQSSTKEAMLQIIKQRKIKEIEAEIKINKKNNRAEKRAEKSEHTEKQDKRKNKKDHEVSPKPKKCKTVESDTTKKNNLLALKKKCDSDMARSIFKVLNLPTEKPLLRVDEVESTNVAVHEEDIARQMDKNININRETLKELQASLLKAQNLVNILLSENRSNDKEQTKSLASSPVFHEETLNAKKSDLPQSSFAPQDGSFMPLISPSITSSLQTTSTVSKGSSHSKVRSTSPAARSLQSEYDDGTWTLQYTKAVENKIIELIPGTDIYISKITLNVINRTAKGQKQMARQLMEAIFTRQALQSCSLSGKKARGLGKGNDSPRPGLHQEAKTVLIEYVQNTAEKEKWPPIADQLIVQSMRAKLNEIRDAGKLNEKLKN